MLKTTFKKEKPKLCLKYCDYKKFDSTVFHTDLQNKLEEGLKVYQTFEETFVGVLDAHAPRKTFYVVIIKLMLTKIFVKPL